MDEINFIVYPQLWKTDRFKKSKRMNLKKPPEGWNIVKTYSGSQYFNDYFNMHHWTTKFVWERFLPILAEKLNLNIVEDDFELKPLVWNKMDFSHHDPKVNGRFRVQSFEDGIDMEGGFEEVVRDIDKNNPGHNWTFYHQMFRLAHRSGIVTNLTIDSDDKIVFNTDSMSVPVIPILANYYKQILVIDARTDMKYGFKQKIQEMNPSHLVNLFFDVSIFHEKKNEQINK